MTEETREHVIPGTKKGHKGETVKGYDFRGDFDFEEMLESYATTGFQASHLKEAIDIIKEMRENNDKIFLTLHRILLAQALEKLLLTW